MPYQKVNDITMYYEWHGKGDVIVFILGLATDISEWGWLIDTIAKNHQLLVFDNRGAGRTDKPHSPYSIAMMTDDTIALLKELGVNRASFIGMSMGGRIALDLTLRHKEMVDKLVLLSTSARVLPSWKRFWVFDVLHRLPGFRGSQPRYAFKRQQQASSGYDCTNQLSQIHVPTLIMNGKHDGFVRPKLVNELHTGIANSQLEMFDGGHIFFAGKERARFFSTLEAFLQHKKD